ncbi:uncharacterized protein N7482_007759 [Penicillium canariense]|uniref:Uncharacterized protein n=1 Tax=Penicillium canariense TaxID=189055 RepID=A0A9W9I044_9EURO|nr:uncharacterized protein N7482_007759 [Penicillium canariense]KAJ5160755.1 hypothetical protein N7482_007759 [Penicillium canariense]
MRVLACLCVPASFPAEDRRRTATWSDLGMTLGSTVSDREDDDITPSDPFTSQAAQAGRHLSTVAQRFAMMIPHIRASMGEHIWS